MGAGPAALCITAELVQQGLDVQAIASKSPLDPWPNTYGIWASELESLNMQELLKYRWKDTVSFFGDGLSKKGNSSTNHDLDYGLFNSINFQEALLNRCNGLSWQVETVKNIDFSERGVIVRTSADKISQQSRAATGVRIQKLDNGDKLSEVVLVPPEQINDDELKESSTTKESINTDPMPRN